jgi:hypothetical protein
MPQTYARLGQSLGDMLGGFAGGHDKYYERGQIDGATLGLRRAQMAKETEEAKRIAQFNDPAQRSSLVGGLLGLKDADAERLKTHDAGGGWGSSVFQKADPDLEMARPKPTLSDDPLAWAKQAGSNALADGLMTAIQPQDRVLPHAAPEWSGLAAQLNAAIQAGGEKAATPQTVSALRAQAKAEDAIRSGDFTAINVLNTLAKEGATYTPFRSDTHGRTTNEGSGAVAVTDAALHDANIGKLLADAIQSRAAAAASTAGAEKTRYEMNNPQARRDRFSQVRDDIRSDFNAMYPISSLNGKRPQDAPEFNEFTRAWLKKFNINEADYFNGTSPEADPEPAQSGASAVPAKNAKGWLLHTDARGNRAYVSPDGKQYEEVN